MAGSVMGGSILNKILNMKHLFTPRPVAVPDHGHGVRPMPSGETEVTMTIVTDRYGEENDGRSPVPVALLYMLWRPLHPAAGEREYPQPPVSFCVPDGFCAEMHRG